MIHHVAFYFSLRGTSISGKGAVGRARTTEGDLLFGPLVVHHRRLTHRQMIYLQARTTRYGRSPTSPNIPVGCLPIVFSVELPDPPLSA